MPLVPNIIVRSALWEGHGGGGHDAATAAVGRAVQVAWNRAAGPGLGRRECEASFVLSDNDFIQNLNNSYRNKNSPTNVLSFQGAGSDVPEDGIYELGDVIFAFETVAQEAGCADISLEDHLSHLAVHGLLHLLGHDHIEDREAEEMEGLETSILLELGLADPHGLHGGS